MKLRRERSSASKNVAANFNPRLEPLEGRRLLSLSVIPHGTSGVGISPDDPTRISVAGTTGNDTIDVDVDPADATQYRVTMNGVATDFPRSQFTGLDITGEPDNDLNSSLGGNDSIFVDAVFAQPCNIDGGPGNDTIFGSNGPDNINGGYGNDSIGGRAGNDTIAGDGLVDMPSLEGNDTCVGGLGDDLVSGDAGNDELHGGKGNDNVSGQEGNDTLFGGAGTDTLTGGDGGDYELGGAGNDLVQGNNGPDTLLGQAGNDTLVGGLGFDVLAGDFEDNLPLADGTTVPSDNGADSLAGGNGQDTILSQSGADTIFGGIGADDIDSRSAGSVIQDFNPGEGDYQPSQRIYTGSVATTVNITLQASGNGVGIVIPSGAGSFAGGTSIARATDGNGHIQFSSNFANANFTLGQFFQQWGFSFSNNSIGKFIAGNGHTTTMTVNGVANTDLQNYVPKNGDVIVITYI
jgi:Ca2+-binding RTX toxin-like protein